MGSSWPIGKKGSAISSCGRTFRRCGCCRGFRLRRWFFAITRIHDGKLVEEAHARFCDGRLNLLGKKKMASSFASELEFFLSTNTFHEAFVAGYQGLDTVE